MPFTIITKNVPLPGQEQIRTKDVEGLVLRIGRGTDNELHLEDHSVQLHHAVIQEVSGAYVLRDLNAVSMTTVNGNRAKEAILTGKGIIRIGPYTLRFSRPFPKAPLCIEYEPPGNAEPTSRAIADGATLTLPVSPVAGRPERDPDATLAITLPGRAQDEDPDATRALPAIRPPGAARSEDPDATRALPAIRPPGATQSEDPDATRILPAIRPPVTPASAAPQETAPAVDTDHTLAMPPIKPPVPSKPAAPPAGPGARGSDKTIIVPAPTSAAASQAVPSTPTAAPPQPIGTGAPPGDLPVVLEEHFADPAAQSARMKIPFAAAYSLDGRYLNMPVLTLVGLLVVAGVTMMGTTMGKRTVLMPGPVSAKHASFVNECVRCHTPTSAIKTEVPDSTCTACHKSPMHFGEHSLAAPLTCTACHLVHKGNTILASVTGKDCLRCHADLKVKNPTFDIHRSITDFGTTHPEFAVMVGDPETGKDIRLRLDDADRLKDDTMVKLNHKLHLDPELPGLQSGPLQCANCHRAAEKKGYLMPSVKFEAACVQCHALDFDTKFSDKTVPHGRQPQELDLYLKILYASLWPLSEDAQAGGKAAAPKEKAWIAAQVEKAEEKLFGKKGTRKRGKCQLCHINDTSPRQELGVDDRVPVLAETAIPDRWFLNSNFNHAAHTMTKCIACHETAPQSEATTDVLLPKVATCRKCHDAQGTASPSCLECHLFHEIPKPKRAQDVPDAKPPGS